MPLTFPSHLAPVLPLKLWRPRWFDGVALVTGAVAPDVAYLSVGTPADLGARTHTLAGLLWWCLPVALGYAWAVRRSVAVVAAHLPDSRTFNWRAYGALATVRHRWWITVGSALVGAASHVGWDWLTHTDGWLRALGVDWYTATGVAWWTVSDLTSTVVGAAVTVALARRVARRREIFDGVPPPAPAVRPRTFRTVAALVGAAGAALLPVLPAAASPAATGVRVLHVGALALLAGALASSAPGVDRRRGRSENKQRQQA